MMMMMMLMIMKEAFNGSNNIASNVSMTVE